MDGDKATLDSILSTVECGFAAVASDIAGTKGEIAELKSEMLDQFEPVDKQFRATNDRLRDIASEIAVIHRRIERLEEQGASNAGFAQENDHALERIAAIEKHLGLDKKISA
jgi:septal ring factor EnvC (AmiA/AmiB activator)